MRSAGKLILLLSLAALAQSACAPDSDNGPVPAGQSSQGENAFVPRSRLLTVFAPFPVAMDFAPDGRLFFTEKGAACRW